MITIILILFAAILFLGMIADKEMFNKRTFCLGFIVCVLAAAAIDVAGKLI